MLSLQQFEDDVCGGCGMQMSDTLGASLTEFEADDPWRCGACDALKHKRDKYSKSNNPGALHFPLGKKEG